jgi:maintenance of morphology protein 1
LVEARVRQWFEERCVQPRYQRVVLPNFWPSRSKEGSQSYGGLGEEVAVDDEEET